MSQKLHNPKSFAPALYISCWLTQVPETLLSAGAKILYGRLSQWSNEKGIVFRSVPQLCEELGKVSASTIERRLKELKDNNLIGTYHPQAGGVNHFKFYDHPWMHEPINKHLVYKNDYSTPPSDVTVPPVRCDGTPPSDVTDINKKEIKEIKDTHTQENFSNNFLEKTLYPNSEQQRKAIALRTLCTNDEKAKAKHESLKTEKSFIDYLNECITHYATQEKPQLVSPQRFISWLERDSRYKKKQDITKSANKYPTPDERAANEQKIREREYKAQADKQQQIKDAKGYTSILSEAARRTAGRPQGLLNVLDYMGITPRQ